MSRTIHGHTGMLLRRLRSRRRVLEMWVWALLVVLPIQGVAVVANGAWRPAHFHRLLAASLQPTSALSVPGSDDVVLERLDGGPRLAVDAATDRSTDSGLAGTRSAGDDAIGHHRHALDAPGVVYLDDPGQSPGDIAKHAPDALLLAQPGWPPLPWPASVAVAWPEVTPAAASRGTPAPERPPRA